MLSLVAEEEASGSYVGSFSGRNGEGEEVKVVISAGDHNYFFCDQDMIRYHPIAFPALPSKQPQGFEWMTEDQDFSRIYGITSAVIVGLVLIATLNAMKRILKTLAFSPFKVCWIKQVQNKTYTCSSRIQQRFHRVVSAHYKTVPLTFQSTENQDSSIGLG